MVFLDCLEPEGKSKYGKEGKDSIRGVSAEHELDVHVI